ncbi:MAG: hypothetical protein WB789_09515 [Thermoplasmata archaeon]
MPARPRPQPPHGRSERLAYVFFHRPRRDVPRVTYERALGRFHERLARHSPAGFRESASFRIPAAPWVESRARPVYVDWYLVDGFRVLDTIREIAYLPPWVRSHRAIAHLASDGWGSIYAGPRGAGPPRSGDRLLWFSSDLRPRFDSTRSGGGDAGKGTLWRRQLALGPGPEFAWATREPAAGGWERAAEVSATQFVFPR